MDVFTNKRISSDCSFRTNQDQQVFRLWLRLLIMTPLFDYDSAEFLCDILSSCLYSVILTAHSYSEISQIRIGTYRYLQYLDKIENILPCLWGGPDLFEFKTLKIEDGEQMMLVAICTGTSSSICSRGCWTSSIFSNMLGLISSHSINLHTWRLTSQVTAPRDWHVIKEAG